MRASAASITVPTSDLATDLPATLAGYKDLHRGETIVVCGCGASLNDLPNPENLITIGVNDVGRLFDPTYLVVVNSRHQFSGDRFRHVETSRARALFSHLDLGIRHPHQVRFRLGKRGGTDFSDPSVLHYTRNSPYVALCLAIHMGASRIGLIGVDFTEDHFFGATGTHHLTRELAVINREYAALAKACNAHGVELVNLSTRSRLTALPKTGIETFLADAAPANGVPTPAASIPRVFFVHYRFLSCGEVFTDGLHHAAQDLGLAYAGAYWDDPELARKVRAFRPDLVFVVHGRRFARRWASRFQDLETAVWLVDEPYEVDDTARWSGRFNTVFVNDPATLDRHTNAHYLPVAFDDTLYQPGSEERDYEVGFIGGHNDRRERMLCALAEAGLLSYVVGGPWRAPELRRLCLAENLPAAEIPDLYRRTRIVINVFRERHHFNRRGTSATSLNPRVYEALACGALVVSEPRPEVAALFPELPVFADPAGLVESVRGLLTESGRVESCLSVCRARLSGHSYHDRLRTVLRATLGAGRVPEPLPLGKLEENMTGSSTPSVAMAPASEEAPRRLPAGWHAIGPVGIGDDGVIELCAYGEERGLGSDLAPTQVELSFRLRLDANARFIAKVHQQASDDPASNSYHLLCTPERDYLARHNRVLRALRVPRGIWVDVRIRRADHSRVEIFINGRRAARVVDHCLQSGYCFVGIGGGRAEVADLRLSDLAGEVPVLRSVPRHAIRATARAPATPERSLPFEGTPRRNLIYHVWPVHGSMWGWNLDQLLARIDLFNGKRVVGIVVDDHSEPADAVRTRLDGHGCEIIEVANRKEGESLTFPRLLDAVASTDPNEVTFYAHAKGVKYEPAVPEPVRAWSEALYRTNLDNWPEVQRQLESKALTGSFRMLGRFRTHRNLGDWHYSGTFFWMRNAQVFRNGVPRVHCFYGGVEAWPGMHFSQAETGCLFLDQLRQLPYYPEFWTQLGNPALERWERIRAKLVPPADLLHPRPIDGHAWPRVEQVPEELDWFVGHMLESGACSLLTIGAMHGGVEWHLARRFREAGRDLDITTVDLSPTKEAQAAFADARERFGQRLELVGGNSASNAVRARLAEHYDAVFIDGDHSYRGARSDWLLALSLSPRLVGFHDIADSSWHAQAHCCVSRLWEEIRREYRCKQRITTDWGGIGVVWPTGA
ncbi:MAG: glycosyltransferase [Thiohalocapsa sp. PB-PSB1]|jgi:hypothetical protein|nr:MAG: glycosyltransferase [Thiohalocapsa sp. PB-PSB1]